MFLPTFARTITFSPNHTTVVTMPIVCPCSLRLRDCWLYLVSSKVGTQYGGSTLGLFSAVRAKACWRSAVNLEGAVSFLSTLSCLALPSRSAFLAYKCVRICVFLCAQFAALSASLCSLAGFRPQSQHYCQPPPPSWAWSRRMLAR